MVNGFGKGSYPTVWKGGIRTNQRERLFFVAAAGLCFSLFLILVFVLNFRSDANAKDVRPAEVLQSVNPGTVTLLAPEHAVKAGETLAGVRFKELYWPRNQVPDGAIHDVAEVQGLYAKVDLSPQIPVQQSNLTKESSQIVLPVTPGNRAVTLDIDETSGIEGHALPGTRVDIVLTYYESGSLTSKIIVQNARIVSAGGDTTTVNELNKTAAALRRSSRTISVDVSVKDALEIQTSKQLGKLSLMMRNVDDNNGVSVTDMTQNDIAGNHHETVTRKPGCKIGRMKSAGKEFIVDCDGTLSEVSNPAEP